MGRIDYKRQTDAHIKFLLLEPLLAKSKIEKYQFGKGRG
jgi:hypothetical protein